MQTLLREKLYHRDIFLPKWFVAPTEKVTITYGEHAKRESRADLHGEIRLPKSITLARFEVIEIGVIGDRVSKILFRGRLDERRDLCIVLIPGEWFAKTCWVNLRFDRHATLNAAKYERQ